MCRPIVALALLASLVGCRERPAAEPAGQPDDQRTQASTQPVGAPGPSSQHSPSDPAHTAAPKHTWTPPWPEPPTAETLYREFDGFVATPADYEQRIRRDAVGYPEGPLLTLALPAYGFANYALAHPAAAEACRDRIGALIEIAAQAWVRRWLEYPMREDLATLPQWNDQGVYLGHYGLMLACYRLAGGDARYAEQQERVAWLLKQGFRTNPSGAWVHSYPHRTWLFDSLPCLLAVRLADVQNGQPLDDSARLTRDHLRFRRACVRDPALDFSSTEIHQQTGKPLTGPRGCDVAASICLLANLAPAECRDLYGRFKKTFWIDVKHDALQLSGFREWPPGQKGQMDADSGPIVLDIGLAASGFGLGAARFAGDKAASDALLATFDRGCGVIDAGLTSVELLRWFDRPPQPAGDAAPSSHRPPAGELPVLIRRLAISKDYHFRHLMADAVAFYCLTWRPWCDPVIGESTTTPNAGAARPGD